MKPVCGVRTCRSFLMLSLWPVWRLQGCSPCWDYPWLMLAVVLWTGAHGPEQFLFPLHRFPMSFRVFELISLACKSVPCMCFICFFSMWLCSLSALPMSCFSLTYCDQPLTSTCSLTLPFPVFLDFWHSLGCWQHLTCFCGCFMSYWLTISLSGHAKQHWASCLRLFWTCVFKKKSWPLPGWWSAVEKCITM